MHSWNSRARIEGLQLTQLACVDDEESDNTISPSYRWCLGVELAGRSGGLSDVVLRELWKLVYYWRAHSVKADFQSTVPHKNKTRGPTATSHPSYDDPAVATGT